MDIQLLNTLFHFTKEYNHQKVRSHDLTDTESMICTYVYSNEGCSQEETARALSLDKTTAGKAIQKLEAKGILVRANDSVDRRRKRLRLTPSGIGEISDVIDLHNEWFQKIFETLSKKEQEQFETSCRRLIEAADRLAKKENNGGNRK